jgi:conjugative transfer signal peptidase TraF
MIRKLTHKFLGLVVLLAIAVVLAAAAGAKINLSRSFPLGLYWDTRTVAQRQDLVYFSPPTTPVFELAKSRGYIDANAFGGYQAMIKKIVAGPGDTVSVTDQGVIVNGNPIKNTKPLSKDTEGRELPYYRISNYQMQGDEVLLISDLSPISFDARYFGPIKRRQIRCVIQPVWTW